ncbi:glycoside hydrolase family 15 protein [Nocardioides sp. MAHUQ-72]|uniref:glycoside hydrolase family 15 protein n=1 Tax=unclassified Nocardioides TaxID=2615069 RepID=UPI00362168F0
MKAPFPPVPLRQYALLADGERGALVGPRGDVAFLCAPRWHDDAVFSSLLGGAGSYAVTPTSDRFVWGGHYDQDTLIWRGRWVATNAVLECRDALALPGDRDRVVLLRRVEATLGDGHVRATLECRAEFGARPMTVRRSAAGVWEGRTGDLRYRWSGVPEHARLDDGRISVHLDVPEGGHHDLVLEISRDPLPDAPPDAAAAWATTERAWRDAVPDLDASAAPGESHHSYAVLRGLTGATGAMVAAATTALPERADQGRNYDYRYAWIRDQCYAGQAAAAVGGHELLDAAVRFVSERVLEDGPRLRPAYTVDGEPVPDERRLTLPGYPGAPVRVGNRANAQFQLDALGEALLLLAAADRAGRLDGVGEKAVEALVEAVVARQDDPDAGIWELEDRRWAHSRLMCAAGLRAVADRRTGRVAADWQQLADRLVASVDRDCRHPDGRWQRSPDDAGVDAALLLPGIRGAVPADDPRHVLTCRAVVEELTDDGYVYRFRQDPHVPFHDSEGAFVLSGFHLSLAALQQGDVAAALRWFERNRGALGPPGLFTEEYDVVQRQLRGNLPQAFVHAVLLETAQRLGEAGVPSRGFWARSR